ncbi:aminotransferase class III-fold pyridoxal phosphate-dependent enzyme, partial [Rhizobium ruizarguesonis]
MLTRGEGGDVGETEDNQYLDGRSADADVNQGHGQSKSLAARVEQAGRRTLTARAFRNDQLAYLYEGLAGLTGEHKIRMMNSGAE